MPDATTRIGRPVGPPIPPKSSFGLGLGVLVIAVAGILATVYLQFVREDNPSVALIEPVHVDPITDLPLPAGSPPPLQAELPVQVVPQTDLPALDESDADMLGWLAELFGTQIVTELVVPERLIRNIVVTIDNMPRQQLVPQQRPLRPTPGTFVTTGTEDEIVLAPENYERYAAVMQLVRNTDPRVPAALYGRFKPLFQQAYEELGYPSRSFQQRVIEVIDHLLATPEVVDPVRLVQPRVMYQYADPRLEALSGGQKWLIRMGAANAAIVKTKLRELRTELMQY